MNEPPFRYRQSQLYGWPFYMARKTLRLAGYTMLRTADALSAREKYPSPLFLRPLLPANRRLKDIHQGRRCFVIGNGPSLTTEDIEPLSGEITFAMNGFLNHPAIDRWQPTYYSLVDPTFFDGSESSNRFLDCFFSIVQASHLIVPCISHNRVADRGDRVTFVSFAGSLANARLRRIDLTRPLPGIMNSAQLAILVALYMGCSPIYLLGMDHDWLAHRGHDPHFYPNTTLENHPNASGDCGKFPYRRILEDVQTVWRGYETLLTYGDSHARRIINCTKGGFLDVFERANLDAVLAARTARRAA